MIKDSSEERISNLYLDMFISIDKLNTLVENALKGKQMKMSDLRKILTDVISVMDKNIPASKVLPRAEQPKGISSLMSKMYKVIIQLANSTIHASKADRMSAVEFLAAYEDSFPYDQFVSMLETHYKSAKVKGKKQTITDDENFKDLEKQIKNYQKSYSKLPSSLGGARFKAFTMPIVPAFKDINASININVLTRAGFNVDRIGDGFIVLKDQYLIAVDRKEFDMKSGFKKVKDGVRISNFNNAERHRESVKNQDKIIELLGKINQRSNTKYALASYMVLANPKNPSIWLFWIVTATQRKSLETALRTVEVSWGLPFTYDLDE